MKIACVQMNVLAGQPERNYVAAEALIRKAARKQPDVILLPETWNTGFAPAHLDPAQADEDGAREGPAPPTIAFDEPGAVRAVLADEGMGDLALMERHPQLPRDEEEGSGRA